MLHISSLYDIISPLSEFKIKKSKNEKLKENKIKMKIVRKNKKERKENQVQCSQLWQFSYNFSTVEIFINQSFVKKHHSNIWKLSRLILVYVRRSNFLLCLAQKAPSTLILTDFTIDFFVLLIFPNSVIVFVNFVTINIKPYTCIPYF